MKTRQEMIYDFMLALAPNIDNIYTRMKEDAYDEPVNAAEGVYATAENLTDIYLRSLP
jgi:hypothetical protein